MRSVETLSGRFPLCSATMWSVRRSWRSFGVAALGRYLDLGGFTEQMVASDDDLDAVL